MKNFAIIKKNKVEDKSIRTVSNCAYLDILATIFTETWSFAKNIKNELENPFGQGRTGNQIDIDVHNSNVKISYCFSDYCIFIDREKLLNIMEKVIDLMEKEADYIVLTQEDENCSIEVGDTLPEGFELYTEGKQLKYRYNPSNTK